MPRFREQNTVIFRPGLPRPNDEAEMEFNPNENLKMYLSSM